MAQHSDSERELYASLLNSTSLALHQAQSRVQEAERATTEQQATIKYMRREDVELRDCLATAEFKLSSSEKRIADLETFIGRLKEELEQSSEAHGQLSEASTQEEARQADAMRQLGEAEVERNSLALQIEHLQQDLQTAKEELTGVEARYSELQAQRLASLSSNEATRALRRQIEELEQRVSRRTEQIGIHQHDIKRLETNLRLQDERLLEMTSELEVAESEKLAMVEDCRTTREERDQALKRCEDLEEAMEELEQRATAANRRRETEVAAVVSVAIDACARRRQASQHFTRALARRDSVVQHLATRVQEAAQSAADSHAIAEQHAASHQATAAQLEGLQAHAQWLQIENAAATQHSTQATVALAAVLGDAWATLSGSRGARMEKGHLQAELTEVHTQFEENLRQFTDLQSKHETLLRDHGDRLLAVQALEAQRDGLQQSLDSLQEEHSAALAELTSAKDELHVHLHDSADWLKEETALREELEAAQQKFQTDADDLRAELARVVAQLETAEVQRASAASTHREAVEELMAAKDELEQGLRTRRRGSQARSMRIKSSFPCVSATR